MKEIIEISRSKCATDYNKEDQKRKAKTTQKKFNKHQTMDLLFSQKKHCMYTGFIYLLLDIIGFSIIEI